MLFGFVWYCVNYRSHKFCKKWLHCCSRINNLLDFRTVQFKVQNSQNLFDNTTISQQMKKSISGINIKDVEFGEHGVIYIKADRDIGRRYEREWTMPATSELLRILLEQFNLFQTGKIYLKKQIFENCSNRLAAKGYKYSKAKCENKWKSLRRSYLTKCKKSPNKSSRGCKRQDSFDEEIKKVIKLEHPEYAEDVEVTEVTPKTNLKMSPIYPDKSEEVDVALLDDEEDEFDGFNETEEYTQNDAELIEMVLRGGNDDNDKQHILKGEPKKPCVSINQKNLWAPENGRSDAEDSPVEEKYSTRLAMRHSNSGSSSENKLVRELKELKKVVKRNFDTNTELLKNQNATNEQLLLSLDTFDKREEMKIDIERRKMEQQGELVQQIKIQNSLIAKLIQKLGNKSGPNDIKR